MILAKTKRPARHTATGKMAKVPASKGHRVMPPAALVRILLPAYGPCPEFRRACAGEMRWKPKAGHVPRGFFGATGEMSEVELVLVFSEPGDPHPGERHSGPERADKLESAYKYATKVCREQRDLFHRNIRKVLDLCWPGVPFAEQTRKVWLTESVLCSARKERGPVRRPCEDACGQRYLKPQLERFLELFPDVLIVGLGVKAEKRLGRIGVKRMLPKPVRAVAPPGCNRRDAQKSWKQIAVELKRRRRGRRPHT